MFAMHSKLCLPLLKSKTFAEQSATVGIAGVVCWLFIDPITPVTRQQTGV
jgi:hypothetical protein